MEWPLGMFYADKTTLKNLGALSLQAGHCDAQNAEVFFLGGGPSDFGIFVNT